jgi:uncharacterized membrane protein YedE/YeeE
MLSISPNSNLLAGAAGGLLIAMSTSALLGLVGEMATISGVLHSLSHGRDGALTSWRSSFVAGMIATGAAASALAVVPASTSLTPVAAVVAGALVGFGTRMGNGCTSGHGVSGLSRFSPRSLVAVVSFMGAGMATATFVGTNPRLRDLVYAASSPATSWQFTAQAGGMMAAILIGGWSLYHLVAPEIKRQQLASTPRAGVDPAPVTPSLAPLSEKSSSSSAVAVAPLPSIWRVHLTSFLSGCVFAGGLLLSGMGIPGKVLGFLNPLSAGGVRTHRGVTFLFNINMFTPLHLASLVSCSGISPYSE